MVAKSVREALDFRFACRHYKKGVAIPKEHLESILQAARLTPSSFGLQPVRIVVVRNEMLREDIKRYAWGQEQITDCSELIILKTLVQDLNPPSNYIEKIYRQREEAGSANAKGGLQGFLKKFGDFLRANKICGIDVANWAARQAYLVADSIMLQAASLGIDSCAVEGFDKQELENFLQTKEHREQIALLLTLGYRLEDKQPPRVRLNLEDIVEYR